MRRLALFLCLLLVSCDKNDNGPDLPTGPSGPTPQVNNPVINRWNVPSGGFFETWVTRMRPERNGVVVGSAEYYTAYRNTSNETLLVAHDFVAEEGHAEASQGLSSISFRFYDPNSASSPSQQSGSFEPVRDKDWTYWRIRIWVLRPGESRQSSPDRQRAADGVLYERFGWRR